MNPITTSATPLPHTCSPNTGMRYCWICGHDLRPFDPPATIYIGPNTIESSPSTTSTPERRP